MRIPTTHVVMATVSGIALVAISLASTGAAQTQPAATAPPSHVGPMFQSATTCMACHNGLTTPTGEDVSMGTLWRASMMAHAARDPYWHAGVRREVTDYPAAQAAIENECSRCHMPMAHVQSRAAGRQQSVFTNLPVAGGAGAAVDPLAVDGVSCALCHQITRDNLGTRASFTGGFSIDTTTPAAGRPMFGPYEIDRGRTAVMRSTTGFQPTTSTHIQQSEMCATCHTLYTHALNTGGETTSEFPEQVPYQEWLHSEFRNTQSCQSCHMPVVAQPTPVTSVLGEPREGLSRHDFRGANFLMLGILNRFRNELGVVATPVELEAAVGRTKAFLQASSASLTLDRIHVANGRLEADVVVRNLAGHKLPTAYPSRRVWIRLAVRDATGRALFVSGDIAPTGAIVGNDNDEDGNRFEPHYQEIQAPGQIQIYEAILGTPAGTVTTGLLSAVTYLKDNRIVPRGFDKRTAPDDVAVHGEAGTDPDFEAGADRVRYRIDVTTATPPFTIEAQLWYQSIAYRWAQNLKQYTAVEPTRFVRYYEQMASASAHMLTSATTVTSP